MVKLLKLTIVMPEDCKREMRNIKETAETVYAGIRHKQIILEEVKA